MAPAPRPNGRARAALLLLIAAAACVAAEPGNKGAGGMRVEGWAGVQGG